MAHFVFDESKVSYHIAVEPDHATLIRGNAMDSGDPAYDKSVEDAIIARLGAGNIWAWAAVTVTARYEGIEGIEGSDHLGCCSYEDEEDFKRPGDYYDDMKLMALADLHEELERIWYKLTA